MVLICFRCLKRENKKRKGCCWNRPPFADRTKWCLPKLSTKNEKIDQRFWEFACMPLNQFYLLLELIKPIIMKKKLFRAQIPPDECLTMALSFIASGESMCSNNPTLNRGFLFWEDISHPSSPFWNLPIWDDPDLNVKHLWVFQIDHIFYKLDVKILAANNKIKCMPCSCPHLHHQL